MGLLRSLELVFFVYFLTHIPMTIFIDSQILLPRSWFPSFLISMVEDYSLSFKDPTLLDPPHWFKSFIYCEIFAQFPFFLFAAYAFWKGSCSWIRVPAIIYSAHVCTAVIPVLAHFLHHDFSKELDRPGPSSMIERLSICAIYLPFLIVPFLILMTMIVVPNYGCKKQLKVS